MQTALLIFILQFANLHHIDPNLALAVAQTESSLNPNAIGKAGEVGVYQIMRNNAKYLSLQDLKNPQTNVAIGLYLLSEAKSKCSYKKDNTWLICYNVGISKAKGIKRPYDFPYYKKVVNAYRRNVREQHFHNLRFY